jgi:hypothetical protein
MSAAANPVRADLPAEGAPPAPVRRGRVVVVRFIAPREIHQTMFGPTVDQAVRDIVERLEVLPRDVAACRVGAEVDLRRPDGRPLAVVQEGLTVEDVAGALQRMAGR